MTLDEAEAIGQKKIEMWLETGVKSMLNEES